MPRRIMGVRMYCARYMPRSRSTLGVVPHGAMRFCAWADLGPEYTLCAVQPARTGAGTAARGMAAGTGAA